MSDRLKYAKMYAAQVWLAYRLGYLQRNPTCCKCGAPATEVAFTFKHSGCWQRFLDRQNHAPACDACLPAIEAGGR